MISSQYVPSKFLEPFIDLQGLLEIFVAEMPKTSLRTAFITHASFESAMEPLGLEDRQHVGIASKDYYS